MTCGAPESHSSGEHRNPSRMARRGLINGTESRCGTEGLINGNGLVNGGALTAGLGKVNGSGLVNGVGYTNGHTRLTLKRNRFGVIFQGDFKIGLSLVVFFLLIFPAVVVLLETEEYKPPIRIDSKFEDWEKIPKFSDGSIVLNDNVNIWRYSTVFDEGYVFFYIEVAAKIFDDPDGVDAVYVFIDEDRSPSSGYRVKDIGADFMIEVFGGDQEVFGSRFSKFRGSEYNWTAWESLGTASTGLSEGKLEVGVRSTEIEGDYDAIVYAKDFEGSESFSSLKFGPEITSLVITLTSDRELLGSGIESFMKLDFTALGGDAIVEHLNITTIGNITAQQLNFIPLHVEEGRTYTHYIHVDTSAATLMDFGEVIVNEAVARSPVGFRVPVTIVGQSARAYIGGKPSGVRIDGLFSDWLERNFDDLDPDVENKNVDITEYAADKDDAFAYFYLKTEGTILGGSAVPHERTRAGEPGVPSGIVVVPREVTGHDVTRIFIDSNRSDGLGLPVEGGRYDYLVEIRGIYGEVIPHLSALYKWDGSGFVEWSTIEIRKNTHQLECSAPLVSLTPLSDSRILFVTTDWQGDRDTIGEPTDWQTRSGTRSIYLVEDTSSPSSNVAFSSQRKLFRDGNYYWSFYFNATLGNMSYEYSADGTSWTNSHGDFPIADAQYASIWYNSSNSGVYVVADNDTTSQTVSVANGTISGTTITWDTPVTVSVSGLDEDYKAAYICVNSSGYVWIASTTRNATSGYNINITYTDNPEDISSWGTPKLMRSSDVSNEYIYPIVLPLDSQDMYVVWYADGNLEGRKHGSGGWESEDSIAVTASGASNKGPSAVAGSGSLHLVYVNTSGYVNYSKYTGSWSTTSLDSTDTGKSPTITLVSGTDDLYALWINSSNQIVGKYSTDGGSSWSPMTGITSDTDPKGNLTSVYSCNLNIISWQFDSSTKIGFEPIPEFAEVLVPVIVVSVLALLRRRGSAETEEEA